MPTNRQFLLAELPSERLAAEHFKLVDGPMPSAGAGEVLLRTRYISLDAANRAWMLGRTYRSQLQAGEVMAGGALAEVVESRDPAFKPGDLVSADTGWQDYAALPATRLTKLGRAEPISHLLGVYGVVGLTAYFGLLKCGEPKPGETVAVSAAAGGVGSLVGQIAKIKGCRTVGIAGGEAKCAVLTTRLGYDAVVDHRAAAGPGELYRALRAAAPEGIDVYFDNVGGQVLEACLFAMREHGRIACCGAASQYDGPAAAYAPRGVPGLIVTKRLVLRGFVVMDFADENERALADLRSWVESGELKVYEDVIDGFEQLPAALIGLLAGENVGKRMVRVV
ncbi:MAG TPA: NADP-dependent oxidoreductase [Caulobacteraceae bacterium]|nr:NADP-dependent oxidoreductase [Caulobacteraceae bacterium]